MSTTPDGRGRHRRAARNLTIAAATLALTGTGVAMAADRDSSPTSKDAAGAAEKGPNAGGPGPLAANEPVVVQARARLARLVADGAIDQGEAEAVERGVIAGRVDGHALVRAGEVSSAHMPAITDALTEVKLANAPAGG